MCVARGSARSAVSATFYSIEVVSDEDSKLPTATRSSPFSRKIPVNLTKIESGESQY